MSCFNHSTRVAVGSCKNCGRALCHDCIAPEASSVACVNRCEEKVQALDAFMTKTVHAKYSTTSVASFVGAFMIAGLSLMLWNIPELETYGIFMGVLSLVLFANACRIWQKK